MKLSKKDVAPFSVTISRNKGGGSRIAPEVGRMISLALEEAGVATGSFAYLVTGKCQGMYASGTFMMTVGTYSENQRTVSINAKYASTAECTVMGYLVIPKGHDIPLVYVKLCEATARLNQEKWARLPMKGEKGRKAHKVKTPEPDTLQKFRIIQGGVPNVPQKKPPAPVSTARAVPLEESQLAALLVSMYRPSTNATFTIKDLSPSVREVYPDRDPRGLATSTVWKLRTLGWTRQVKTRSGMCWQIEESFLRLQGIADTFMQLPAIGKTITPESHVPQQKVSYPGAKLTESDLRAIGLYRQLAKDRDERIAELEAKTKALRAVQNDIARVIEKATPEALAKLFK